MKKYRLITILLMIVALAGCATTSSRYTLAPALEKDIVSMRGSQYIPLIRLCDEYRIKYAWDEIARTVTLEGKGTKIVLRPSSDRMLVGGRVRRMDRPAAMKDGAVFVPLSFVRTNLNYLTEYRQEKPVLAVRTAPSGKFAIRKIVLDAGHGGKDGGAVGKRHGLIEKHYALKAARKLKSILENKGISVVMTRSDDRFVSLRGRADMANRANADLFVSVHINASRYRGMHGFECYYLSNAVDDNSRATEALENSFLNVDEKTMYDNSRRLSTTLWDMMLTENRAESAELARYICSAVKDTRLVRNNGVKSARFYVLKHSSAPAVLVELCYISHSAEETKLKDPVFLDKMTAAVARGILRYKDEYERTEGFTNI